PVWSKNGHQNGHQAQPENVGLPPLRFGVHLRVHSSPDNGLSHTIPRHRGGVAYGQNTGTYELAKSYDGFWLWRTRRIGSGCWLVGQFRLRLLLRFRMGQWRHVQVAPKEEGATPRAARQGERIRGNATASI